MDVYCGAHRYMFVVYIGMCCSAHRYVLEG